MNALDDMHAENAANSTSWHYIMGWLRWAVESGNGADAATLLAGFMRAEAAGNRQRAARGRPPVTTAVDYLTSGETAA